MTDIRYLEIVTLDVDVTIASLEASLSMTFSEPVAALGNAKVAPLRDGGRIGVRAPMHDAESPVVRPYYGTGDIQAATDAAVAAGAELAHPVLELPGHGWFSIVIQGGNQFGFWQD